MDGDRSKEGHGVAKAGLLPRLPVRRTKPCLRDELLLGEEIFATDDPRDPAAGIYDALEVPAECIVLVCSDRAAQIDAIAPIELLLPVRAENDVLVRGFANGKRLRGAVERTRAGRQHLAEGKRPVHVVLRVLCSDRRRSGKSGTKPVARRGTRVQRIDEGLKRIGRAIAEGVVGEPARDSVVQIRRDQLLIDAIGEVQTGHAQHTEPGQRPPRGSRSPGIAFRILLRVDGENVHRLLELIAVIHRIVEHESENSRGDDSANIVVVLRKTEAILSIRAVHREVELRAEVRRGIGAQRRVPQFVDLVHALVLVVLSAQVIRHRLAATAHSEPVRLRVPRDERAVRFERVERLQSRIGAESGRLKIRNAGGALRLL